MERLNFGQTSTPCILGTVTGRQNHLHITFRDLNEEYKEESIHQHCMKNEHPHTKTKQTLLITLEPPVPEMMASHWLARNFFFGPVKN